MRIARILSELGGQLRQASAELRDLLLELSDPLPLGGKRGFQLRDSLVPPVLGHEASDR